MNTKKSPAFISIIIIMLIMIFSSSNLNWGKKSWKNIVETDAKGYYAYLPAAFIYQDFNFTFFDSIEGEKYNHHNLYYDYRAEYKGKTINKYYCGTAVAAAPFFIAAHVASYAFGFDPDGYSKLYPIFINIAALFYLLIGLIYFNSYLKNFSIKAWPRAITLFASVFGTHLFYYTVGEPGFSHIYSFAFFNMFLYYAHQYFHAFSKKYIVTIALILGIITLIRPINGLLVFSLPFIAGSHKIFMEGLWNLIRSKIQFLLGILAFLAILSIQLIIYKISTGHFIVYSYGEEGFNFLDPHFIDILFSYRKGLFLYTPIFLFSLVGSIYLWRSSRYKFFAWFSFLIGITYIFSSWWMWYYGGSFSSRVYVEFIPFFMILLATALNETKTKAQKQIWGVLLTTLIIVCQFQTFQYRHLDIHWSEMNKEKYWDVFMRVDKYIK